MDVGLAGKRRIRFARNRDQPRAHALDQRQDRDDLVGFARVRDCKQRVLFGDHAEVAVACLRRMHEKGRRARARQCRGDFRRNMARLSHSGDDDPTRSREAQPASLGKAPVESRPEPGDRAGLDVQYASGQLDQIFVG